MSSVKTRNKAKMSLAENLRQLRSQHGLSQQALAESIGVSHPRISDIERGMSNPRLSTLVSLAEFFGVSVAELLDQKTFAKNG